MVWIKKNVLIHLNYRIMDQRNARIHSHKKRFKHSALY